jgi:hypothetical protein
VRDICDPPVETAFAGTAHDRRNCQKLPESPKIAKESKMKEIAKIPEHCQKIQIERQCRERRCCSIWIFGNLRSIVAISSNLDFLAILAIFWQFSLFDTIIGFIYTAL